MPESPTAVLGTFSIDAQWPLTFTPPARTITVSSNALATDPVQVNDYISDFGVINITAIIKGTASEGETAADHVVRQITNLNTEIAKDTNTLTVTWGDSVAATAYTIYKSPPPTIAYDAPFGRADVAFVTFELNYLP